MTSLGMLRNRWHRRYAAAGAAAVLIAAAAAAAADTAGPAATSPAPLTRQQAAKLLVDSGRARFATGSAQRALALTAGLPQSPGRDIAATDLKPARQASGGAAPLAAGRLRNVRVNSPGEDKSQVDQTTQSETSIAVSGKNVAVGFNDSQQALFGYTDGLDFSGYGYSRDGGASFTDGGTLPNPANFTNFGDPWLTSDRAGRMYYSTLTYGGNVGNLEVGVARSDDGGRSWAVPTFASPNNDTAFYQADKDAVVAGRDPQIPGRDNVYATWDDFNVDLNNFTITFGLAVSTSTDHGLTWSMHYADQLNSATSGCSSAQWIGAQPVVDPADGTLYLAAEKISVDDPACTFTAPVTVAEVLYISRDAGATFGPSITISPVTQASPTGALVLGPGQYVRTAEFPTVAIKGPTLFVSWNDGSSGRSHIRLATSGNHGQTWTITSVTNGSGDEIQPAIAADRAGLHVAYYQRNANDTLDTVVADSSDNGVHFSQHRVTSRSFPGVRTIPQFDPQLAFGYMGDYISMTSDGTHQYFAWGDNRDRIVDFTHPQGRNDPNVYFARR